MPSPKENEYRRNRYKILRLDPEWVKKHNEKRRKYRDSHRKNIIKILGGNSCSCKGEDCWHEGKCNVKDERCSQLDHVNNDGYKERKSVSDYKELYRKYAKNPELTKKQLQVLCANCNWVKRFNRKAKT